MTPTTTTNYCGYNAYGIRIAVIFPAIDRAEPTWYVANHRRGGYNVPHATVADARAYCEFQQPAIACWDTVEVSQ